MKKHAQGTGKPCPIAGLKLSKEQLVNRFGVSRRVAVRVAALLARGVAVSAAFLESVRADHEAETLLLCPELLGQAAALIPEGFSVLAARHCAGATAPVMAVNDDGSRVIALRDELKAEQPRAMVKTTDARPVLLSPISTALQVISEDEARTMFTPQEIGRLKMTILTSADPARKIEAIRRLALSPLDPNQKGTVLIHALGDHTHSVRVEAAEALTAFGLNPVIAQSARSLGEGNVKQRNYAAERMGVLAEQVTESEISVILALLAGAMSSEESNEVKARLIRSFKGACALVAMNRAYTAALLRLLIRELEGAAEALYRPVREILGEVGRHNPATMTDLVLIELSTIKARPLRRLLFGVLGMFDVPEDRRAELAGLAVDDLKGSAAPEEDCQGIGSMLRDWGPVGIRAILASLPKSEDAQKIYMVRLLDEMAHRSGGQAADEIGTAFLNLLRVSSKHVRTPVIESRAITHPSLPEPLKLKIAEELTANLTQFANPRMTSVIEAAVVRLGASALPVLKALLVGDEHEARQKSICHVAAEIVAGGPEPERAALADDLLETCMQHWQASENKKGYFAETIGRIALCSSATPDALKQIAGDLGTVVFNTPDPFGVLLALGHLSASPRLGAEARFHIADIFFDLLNATLPELTDKVLTSAEDDDVHHFGREVTAYTEMIPACLEGLEKLYFGTPVKSLRARVADFLIEKWNNASKWTTIWGPESISLMLKILGRIARDTSTDAQCRARIVEALAERLDFLPVVEELGGIFASRDASPRLGAAACKIGFKLVRSLHGKRDRDQAPIIKTLGMIAARTNLGKDPDAARKLREVVLHVLYEAVKANDSDSLEALKLMEQCPALSAAAREEIRVRLEIISEAKQEAT